MNESLLFKRRILPAEHLSSPSFFFILSLLLFLFMLPSFQDANTRPPSNPSRCKQWPNFNTFPSGYKPPDPGTRPRRATEAGGPRRADWGGRTEAGGLRRASALTGALTGALARARARSPRRWLLEEEKMLLGAGGIIKTGIVIEGLVKTPTTATTTTITTTATRMKKKKKRIKKIHKKMEDKSQQERNR